MSTPYKHPGDAWTDIETPTDEHIYCDRCAEAETRQLSERFGDDDELAELGCLAAVYSPHRLRVRVGYFNPRADDRCDKCGVVASQQGGADETE